MRQYKTEAVILNTTDVFDADRSLLLFTRTLGKLRARAKGVRKPTSRLTGHLLVFLPTQIELIESREYFLVVGASVVNKDGSKPYPEDSLDFLRWSSILAEAINLLFIERQPHPQLYDGLVYTLDRMRAQSGQAAMMLIAGEFILKSLQEMGYKPELQHCVLTGKKVEESFIGWSSSLGGVLSEEGYRQVMHDARRLESARTIVAMREMLKPNFIGERLQMSPEVAKELWEIITHYLQTVLERPLRSL